MPKTAWILAALSAVLFLLGHAAEEDALSWSAVLLMGSALTVLYRPTLVQRMAEAHSVELADFALAAVCCLGALLLALALTVWVSLPSAGTEPLTRWALESMQLAAAGLPIVPIGVQIAANLRTRGRQPPIWPAAVGLAGGAAVSAVTFVIVGPVGDGLLTGSLDDADRPLTLAALALAGLLGGVGLACWSRALNAGETDRFDGRGVFRFVATSTAALVAAGVAICLEIALRPPLRGSTALVDQGLVGAALLSGGVGLVWIVTLLRLRGHEPGSPLRAVGAVALLLFALPSTLLIPAWPASSGDWAPLALFLVAPIAVALAVGVALPLPWMVRRVLGVSR